ncbi:hypothetical protein [Pseudonocardia sp. H11422]|uniref:hypothetical protein n=1 Tax=Pseudonocardia sp. H11422 TaxID=2835866 RepID=UPI001BDCE1C2|nr:hypothetical protein [Pseudonocardia sp. H11422]
MNRPGARRLGPLALAVWVVGLAACGPVGQAPDDSGAAPAPTRFAPYVDASVSPLPLLEMADATGVADVVLAFVLATDGRCAPSWAGVRPLTDPEVVSAVRELRDRGGELTVATGGANGPYLESTCGSVADLVTAYTTALDAVGTNRLDVDIEAEIPVDTVVTALAQLQAERDTAVSLTLGVAGQDVGLAPAASDLVRRADAAGVRFTVNAMVMNFDHRGEWATAMIEAVDAVATQLRGVWPQAGDDEIARRIGVTAMVGRTDFGPVTTPDDAGAVAAAAHSRGVDYVGFWSLGRDNGDCPGRPEAAFDCSGIEQSRFAFTEIFRDAVASR